MEARANAAAGARADEALLLALGQLRGELQGSQPLRDALGTVRRWPLTAGVRAALQPLAASASAGVPSLAGWRSASTATSRRA